MSLRESKSKPKSDDEGFRAEIVRLISSDRDPEQAIEALSRHYNVERPSLRMGLPKGESKALGCYLERDKTIYISKQEYLYDPYVIVHEFYHHLRNVSGKHRGTERHAKEFALAFLRTQEKPT